ncbi:MAG TPA: MFS transporter [Actinomycetota bacterium]|jgi:MFS family permease|nr:MFS transporter [Actinomycetota bacterium]
MNLEAEGPEQHPAAAALVRRPGSWAVLGAYVALVAVSHMLWISFASVSGRAAHAFGTTEVSIGLLVSVGPLCSAALSIPAGVIADRYGYRTPLLWAGLATSVFAFLRPLAGGFPVLLILTVGLLLPQPFLINAVADLVNRHFPEEESATATGLGTMAIFLGITLGLVVTPGLVSALGVRGSQATFAVVSVLALGAFWRLTFGPVPGRLVTPEELSMRDALARVLRSGTQWKLSAALFLGFGFYLGITAWLEEILKPRGIDETGAGLVAGTITIAGMVGSVVLGAASDRIRRRKPFLVAAGLVAAPTLWLLGHLWSLGSLVGVAFALGFFLLAALPIAIAVASEDASLGPQVGSTAVGVMLLAGNLGGAAVVIGMGALKSVRGDFSAAIELIAALAVLVALIAVTIPEPLRRPGRG